MPVFQQHSAPSAPAVPVVPVVPAVPAPGAYVVNSSSLPGGVMTRQDIATLQNRRSELSRQLESATGRRRQLADQIKQASGADRAGLEGRLTVLDNRISRLEGDIDEVGSQLASPAASRVGTTSAPPDFGRNIQFSHVNPVAIVVPFTLFVLSPIALSVSRLIWKRSSRQAPPPMTTDSAQRLERIEQAMDAIAIEVERVSEGQRFVTRLLSERAPAALGVGQQPAEAVRVPLRDADLAR